MRNKKRKKRNGIAKALQHPSFKQQVVPSKKQYKRNKREGE